MTDCNEITHACLSYQALTVFVGAVVETLASQSVHSSSESSQKTSPSYPHVEMFQRGLTTLMKRHNSPVLEDLQYLQHTFGKVCVEKGLVDNT